MRVLALLLCCSCALPAAEGDRIKERLHRAIADRQISGAVLVIVHDTRAVFDEAVGTAGAGRPMIVNSDFRLGEASAPFTASAILTLVDKGEASLEELRPLLSDARPESYAKAARIAQERSGLDLERLLRERILEPVGLNLTFYTRTKRKLDYVAGHGVAEAVRPFDGLTSRALDIVPFLQMHRRRGLMGSLYHLSPKLAAEMRRDQTGKSYGLGWQLDEIGPDGVANVFYSTGRGGCILWVDARADLEIILLTTTPIDQLSPLWRELLPMIRQEWK